MELRRLEHVTTSAVPLNDRFWPLSPRLQGWSAVAEMTAATEEYFVEIQRLQKLLRHPHATTPFADSPANEERTSTADEYTPSWHSACGLGEFDRLGGRDRRQVYSEIEREEKDFVNACGRRGSSGIDDTVWRERVEAGDGQMFASSMHGHGNPIDCHAEGVSSPELYQEGYQRSGVSVEGRAAALDYPVDVIQEDFLTRGRHQRPSSPLRRRSPPRPAQMATRAGRALFHSHAITPTPRRSSRTLNRRASAGQGWREHDTAAFPVKGECWPQATRRAVSAGRRARDGRAGQRNRPLSAPSRRSQMKEHQSPAASLRGRLHGSRGHSSHHAFVSRDSKHQEARPSSNPSKHTMARSSRPSGVPSATPAQTQTEFASTTEPVDNGSDAHQYDDGWAFSPADELSSPAVNKTVKSAAAPRAAETNSVPAQPDTCAGERRSNSAGKVQDEGVDLEGRSPEKEQHRSLHENGIVEDMYVMDRHSGADPRPAYATMHGCDHEEEITREGLDLTEGAGPDGSRVDITESGPGPVISRKEEVGVGEKHHEAAVAVISDVPSPEPRNGQEGFSQHTDNPSGRFDPSLGPADGDNAPSSVATTVCQAATTPSSDNLRDVVSPVGNVLSQEQREIEPPLTANLSHASLGGESRLLEEGGGFVAPRVPGNTLNNYSAGNQGSDRAENASSSSPFASNQSEGHSRNHHEQHCQRAAIAMIHDGKSTGGGAATVDFGGHHPNTSQRDVDDDGNERLRESDWHDEDAQEEDGVASPSPDTRRGLPSPLDNNCTSGDGGMYNIDPSSREASLASHGGEPSPTAVGVVDENTIITRAHDGTINGNGVSSTGSSIEIDGESEIHGFEEGYSLSMKTFERVHSDPNGALKADEEEGVLVGESINQSELVLSTKPPNGGVASPSGNSSSQSLSPKQTEPRAETEAESEREDAALEFGDEGLRSELGAENNSEYGDDFDDEDEA